MFGKLNVIFLIGIMLIGGCSRQVVVPYQRVEKNNWVTVKLYSGDRVEGNVLKAEPHIITVRNKAGRNVAIETSRIQEIKRIPPHYDDFGHAISEEEISKEKTGKNATIYGIGGGVLSFGASFFIGSMVAKDSENGGAVLAAVTATGGILGTTLFVQAGKKQDRKEAVQRIRENRKSTQIPRKEQLQPTRDLRDTEKKKLEELRRQREKLLRELEASKKKNE